MEFQDFATDSESLSGPDSGLGPFLVSRGRCRGTRTLSGRYLDDIPV